MIVHQIDNHIVYDHQIPCPANWVAYSREGNLITYYSGIEEYKDIVEKSPLTIKYVPRGKEVFDLEHKRLSVSGNQFSIITSGSTYQTAIRSERKGRGTDSMAVFFNMSFLQDELNFHLTSDMDLLEGTHYQGEVDGLLADEFTNLSGLQGLARSLGQLWLSMKEGSRLPSDNIFEVLTENLLSSSIEVQKLIDQVPLAKTYVREEVFRRMLLAREFINYHLDHPIDLETIATEIGMSSYHFHRLFRRTFGITPIQFLTDRRMIRARHLLKETSMTVEEVCQQIGYESIPTFSLAFKRATGTSPGMSRGNAA